MSLTQDFADANYIITGFQADCVLINNEPHSQSLIICPDELISPWPVNDIKQLRDENVITIIKLKPEVILLGTGKQANFPEPEIIAQFAQHGIGLETMNTAAACRTYGILVAEGRRAAAALIFPKLISKCT